jgi:putative SOS response-associated peptidase YedK
MCGRYSITIDKSTIEQRFGAKFYIAEPSYYWSPTYNAAPLQMLPIIRTYNPDRIELAAPLYFAYSIWNLLQTKIWNDTATLDGNSVMLPVPLVIFLMVSCS